MTVVFIDTETTSRRPDRRAWDIALIVRDHDERAVGDEPGEYDREHQWFVRATDLDLGNADLTSLKIGRYYQRHPEPNGPGHRIELQPFDQAPAWPSAERMVLREVEALTRGAIIVGAVPNFDTEVLADRMRSHGICPAWHYHLCDVETLAAGAMRKPPPWNFDELLGAYGLVYAEADRHTALGDARMVRDLYDAVMAGDQR